MASNIEKLLGLGCRRFTKDVAGRAYRGYVNEPGLRHEGAVSFVLKNRAAARKIGARLFAGYVEGTYAPESKMGICIYAVSRISDPEVADLAGVGVLSEPGVNTLAAWRAVMRRHPDSVVAKMVNSGRMTLERLADPDPDLVRSKMRRFFQSVYRRLPYEIYYADRKGCRAKFLEPVTATDAAWLERKIRHVDPEADDIVKYGTLRADIKRLAEMRLWWD